MELWIVGRCRNPDNAKEWEFMGVFDHRDKAVTACREWYDFVAPTELNKRQPDDPSDFPAIEWPLAEVSQ